MLLVPVLSPDESTVGPSRGLAAHGCRPDSASTWQTEPRK